MSGGLMTGGRVLVVAGTHGNERNGPWLLEAWQRQPGLLDRAGLDINLVLGNPAAYAAGRRYIERDLNRSFAPELLNDPACHQLEVELARHLLARHGPAAPEPALVAIDLHSTTAAMGSALVVYGRRPADLALAAGIQQRLGLPVYLHEGDPVQTGYLVERWPCGLVVEVGPVPQGVLSAPIVRQTQLALEAGLAVLSAACVGHLNQPPHLVIHRHLGSVDLPRHDDGTPAAVVHPARLHRDWQVIPPGDPLFLGPDGRTIPSIPKAAIGPQPVWGVFISEAAYGEKGIALSLTRRECWTVLPSWTEALMELARGLARQPSPLPSAEDC